MVLDWWQARRRCRRAEREQNARQVRERAWSIFREVVEPVVSEGRAKLSHPITEGVGKYDKPDEWIGVQPASDAAAPVAISAAGAAWIDLSVGEPFPVGSVYELLIEEGWEEELRLCLQAVIEGRYGERVSEGWLGQKHEMVFRLPDEERKITRLALPESDQRKPGQVEFDPY